MRDDCGRILREAVEYSVVDHCNLRCAGCDHASPHLAKRLADPAAFAADMQALSRHLHVRVLRLLGGEPLLHPTLDAFVRDARTAGIADQIMLWTNGVLLHRAGLELLESFDIVRVSLYPNVQVRVDLAELARELQQRGKTRLLVVPVNRFQHQVLNDPIEDFNLVRRIYVRCKDAHSLSCHTVFDGRYYKCAKAPVLEPRLAGCGVEVSNRASDGVALHRNPLLGEDLARYLTSTEPLIACRWCLGTDGTTFEHYQLDARGMEQERCTGTVDARTLLASPARRLVRDVRDAIGTA